MTAYSYSKCQSRGIIFFFVKLYVDLQSTAAMLFYYCLSSSADLLKKKKKKNIHLKYSFKKFYWWRNLTYIK
jgi:hypothetical protein